MSTRIGLDQASFGRVASAHDATQLHDELSRRGHLDALQLLPTGLIKQGNINLDNRPIVKNPDGSISTVRSITIGVDGKKAFLIPTVVGDKVVSNQDAIEHFAKTGEHLGLFSSEQSANNYAVSLHESQASQYTDDANGLLLNGTQDDNYNPSPPVDATRVARTNIPPAKMSQVVVAIK